MHERVKNIGVLLFLIIAGLVGYQWYAEGLPSADDPIPSPSSVMATTPPSATATPRVVIIEGSPSPSAQPADPLLAALVQAGVPDPRIDDLREDREVFAIRLETLSDNVRKREVVSGGTVIGVLYELPRSAPYPLLKAAILERVATSPVWAVNETNAFGRGSFYMNNRNRSDTVFLMVDFASGTLGFEYPKANHAAFEKLFQVLGS